MEIWIGYRREHPSICNDFSFGKGVIAVEKAVKTESFPQFKSQRTFCASSMWKTFREMTDFTNQEMEPQ